MKLLLRKLYYSNNCSEIKILVGSNEDAQVTLLISYFIFNVTWETCYDFRTFTSEDEKSTVVFKLIVMIIIIVIIRLIYFYN
jgi:hypothetical protein